MTTEAKRLEGQITTLMQGLVMLARLQGKAADLEQEIQNFTVAGDSNDPTTEGMAKAKHLLLSMLKK